MCWHCHDTNACDCVFCGADKIIDGLLTRVVGKCGVCVAVAFNERHRDVIDRCNPTDRNNWEYHPPADGNKQRRIYKPFIGLK